MSSRKIALIYGSYLNIRMYTLYSVRRSIKMFCSGDISNVESIRNESLTLVVKYDTKNEVTNFYCDDSKNILF